METSSFVKEVYYKEMINWILYTIIAALLWALVNHMDKFLLSKYCKDREIGGLVIFSGIIALPVMIVLAIFNPQIFINIDLLSTIFIIIGGIMYIIGIIPYLYALDEDEASTVTPQMLMIPVFSLIFGFIFLNEKLNVNQLLGSAIVIVGSLLIATDFQNKLITKLKLRIFFTMVIYCTLVAFNILLFKYVAKETSFISTLFWLHVGYFLCTLFIIIFIDNYRNQFVKLVKNNTSQILTVNIVSEVITLIGNVFFNYATLLVPIAVAEVAAEGAQPFFVILIGIVITKFFPNIGKEDLSLKKVLQKILAVVVMVIGFILLTEFT